MGLIESETYGLLISELDKRVPNRSLSKIRNNKNYFIERGYNLFNNATKETVLQLKVVTLVYNNFNTIKFFSYLTFFTLIAIDACQSSCQVC